MSHYSCAVFSHKPEDIDELLAPYAEDVEPGSPFTVFEEDEEADIDDITGKHGCWRNLDARWDWWTIGGRWSGYLRLKNPQGGCYDHLSPEARRKQMERGVCDQALASDCLFEPDEELRQSALKQWDAVMKDAEEAADYGPNWFGREAALLREQYGSREQYAEEAANKRPFAYITATGRWHDIEWIDYRGINDDAPAGRAAYNADFDAYLERAVKGNLFITIVDLHI